MMQITEVINADPRSQGDVPFRGEEYLTIVLPSCRCASGETGSSTDSALFGNDGRDAGLL
jgi:hypothetical protein